MKFAAIMLFASTLIVGTMQHQIKCNDISHKNINVRDRDLNGIDDRLEIGRFKNGPPGGLRVDRDCNGIDDRIQGRINGGNCNSSKNNYNNHNNNHYNHNHNNFNNNHNHNHNKNKC